VNGNEGLGFNFLMSFFFSKEVFSEEVKNPWDKIVLRIDDVPPLSEELVKTIHELGIKKGILSVIGKNLLNHNGVETLKKLIEEG